MESGVSETISNLTSDTRDKLGTNGRNTRDKKHPLNFNTSFSKGLISFLSFGMQNFVPSLSLNDITI